MTSIVFKTPANSVTTHKLNVYRKRYSSTLTYTVDSASELAVYFRDERDYVRFCVVWDGEEFKALPEMGPTG